MARQDERRNRRRGEARKTITVKSMVVVLTGRQTPWSDIGELRTSDKTHRFVGVEFSIELVYQRTVRELEGKGLAFLACVHAAQFAATKGKHGEVPRDSKRV